MKSIHRIFYFVFFLSIILAQSNQAKSTAAVLDFTGSGISNQEAQVLTDRLGTELVQTKVMIIVERNQMTEIMDEQGLQQSGCTSAECAAADWARQTRETHQSLADWRASSLFATDSAEDKEVF